MLPSFRSLSTLLAIVTAMVTLTIANPAFANNDYRIEAKARSGRIEAKGDYRERIQRNALRQTFKVEVTGAAPGQVFDISINGNLFGQVTANSLGRAHLEFASAVVDDNPNDNEPPLPTDFPHLNVGDTITIGTMTATFRLH